MRTYTNNFENFFGSNSRKHATHRGLYCVWTLKGGALVRRWVDPEAESNSSGDEKETTCVETEAVKQHFEINLWAA